MKLYGFFEKKQHGTPDFPIVLYEVDKEHPQYIMPFHWHNELEIIKVYSGNLKLFVDNNSYCLSSGDIAFINCKSTHRAEPEGAVYKCIVCDISMMSKKNSIISLYINPILNETRYIECIPDKNDLILQNSIDSLFSGLKSKSEFYELSAMSELFLIFERLYKGGSILSTNQYEKKSSSANSIADITDWIDENFSYNITLNRLAKQSGMSPNYFCKIFKVYTGKTPIEYLNYVRIENVCNEILWNGRRITDAAIDSGFDNISYFCRVFKYFKGVSAKEFLKQNTIIK